MKRFKSIAGLAAGLVLAGSMLAAPALAQPPAESNGPGGGYNNNTTNVSVTFTSDGAFDAYFCQVLGSHSPSTSLTVVQPPTLGAAGLATGQLTVCYDDTLPTRPGFHVDITAGAFGGGTSTIPLSGFTITEVSNVQQHYWGDADDGPGHPDYGDIGVYVNNAYPSGQPANGSPAPWVNSNTLDFSRHLQFGWPGVGTDWSYGQFGVSLVIPVGTFGGLYTSTMTIDVLGGTP